MKTSDASAATNFNANMDVSTKMEPDGGFDSTLKAEEAQAEEPKKVEDASDDPLAALASAALDHSKEHKKTEMNGSEQSAKDTWYTVGFIKGNSCDVQSYFPLDDDTSDLSVENLPELSNFPRINLEPGTAWVPAWRLSTRVGRGEWSEVSAFKTCLPGFPGAPSAIKIAKSGDGAHLSWEPPSANQGEILEYSVYLAVRERKNRIHPSVSIRARILWTKQPVRSIQHVISGGPFRHIDESSDHIPTPPRTTRIWTSDTS
ncbi:hypothetical protein NQ318_002465 [Aromia moschata]|uniref:Fibronectin type-III domain-containing protein n=1 Tax=Aromia moschata TaxID=1265417 RepID=A0AAV8Y980_9CUCU|nr:hypothetical protein NQ318_002465 [Aromia moschata]